MATVEWYSWGSGGAGLLALGDLDDRSTPNLVTAPPFGTLTASTTASATLPVVTSLACSGVYSLACTADGAVHECGDINQSAPALRQPGTNESQFLVRPTKLPFPHSVTAVSCGWSHSACITADGKVWTWGDNRCGQLGLLSTDSPPPAFVRQPTPLHLPAPALAVACGWRHSIALLNDHSLQGWGDNKHAQLSLPPAAAAVPPLAHSSLRSSFIWPPTALPAPSLPTSAFVRAIACGWRFSLLLTSSHSVFTCGSNQWQQCSPVSSRTVPHWMHVEGLPPISQATCGWSHCLARDEDGRVWQWGRRSMGQAGSGPPDEWEASVGPVQIPLGEARAVEVVCGSESCMAVDDSGRLWGWGWNEHGNVGGEQDVGGSRAAEDGCVWEPRVVGVGVEIEGLKRRVTRVVAGGASVFAQVCVESLVGRRGDG